MEIQMVSIDQAVSSSQPKSVTENHCPLRHSVVLSPTVALDQRRKGQKSMSRRSGQKGQVVKKGRMWHVRFYVDLPEQEKRKRKSVPIGPCTGKDKLTRPEAERKGAEIIASLGVNTAEHLERAMNLTPVVTFGQRVEWCRKYHKA